MVLGTDMICHFSELGKMKSRIQADDFDPSSTDKSPCMNLVLHMADISNSTKNFSLARVWVENLF
jgi:hypothetical protein